MSSRLRFALLTTTLALGCGGSGVAAGVQFPAREPGCDVQIFHEEPSYKTANIGAVRATCDVALSDDACRRELEDQACKLGADTVWGVDDPDTSGGKKRLSGRAAHRQ